MAILMINSICCKVVNLQMRKIFLILSFNGDLDNNEYAFIEIMGITDESQITTNTYIRMKYRVDSFNADYQEISLALIQGLGTSIPFLQTLYTSGVLYERNMDHKIGSFGGDFIGELRIAVTGEFPIEDTGYMEEDFDFCINEGLNLVSYPCENDIAINDALPSEIANNLSSIVGEGVAGVNNNGNWVGSLTQLQSGSGYWFNSNVEACFNYECAEN